MSSESLLGRIIAVTIFVLKHEDGNARYDNVD